MLQFAILYFFFAFPFCSMIRSKLSTMHDQTHIFQNNILKKKNIHMNMIIYAQQTCDWQFFHFFRSSRVVRTRNYNSFFLFEGKKTESGYIIRFWTVCFSFICSIFFYSSLIRSVLEFLTHSHVYFITWALWKWYFFFLFKEVRREGKKNPKTTLLCK